MSTFIFSACTNQSSEEIYSQPPKKVEISEIKEPEDKVVEDDKPCDYMLHYVDAWGEWHNTTINVGLRMHPYNFLKLKYDGQTATYEDEEYTVRHGVDVSHHQGEIDWEKVKAAGYDFAILRCAYRGYGESGQLNEDKQFANYIDGAHAAGLDVGVYIFSQAISEEEAVEEADFVLKLLEGRTIELPIAYDPESIRDDAARTDDLTGEQATLNTLAFCNRLAENNYEPMIYSNMIWEADYFDMSVLECYPKWYADYENAPQTPYDFTFWQYSEKGHVDGINTEVDLDLWFVKK